jgi:hypothetical protein
MVGHLSSPPLIREAPVNWGLVVLSRSGFSGHDGAADQLGYLWHQTVAQTYEALTSVHLAGRPINHSTHVGFNCPPIISGN